MGEPAATAQPGPDNPPPQAVEQRTCRVCEETKAVSPETWPYRSKRPGAPYKAVGRVCGACEAKRKVEYDMRRTLIAEFAADVPPEPLKGNSSDKTKQRDAVNQSKLDVAAALKAGSRALNEIAPNVLARIICWAEDTQHEQHVWANEFLANRILPKKLFEELGGEAAGLGSLQDKRPQYIIQILPATTDAPGRVIDAVHTVEALEHLPQEGAK
jgi:hypothetical protein